MVTDAQVRRLMKLIQTEETLAIAASKAGMDEKTARKYRDAEQLPSQMKTEHTWRTRPDFFEEVWPDVQRMLELNDGLSPSVVSHAIVPLIQRSARSVVSPSLVQRGSSGSSLTVMHRACRPLGVAGFIE